MNRRKLKKVGAFLLSAAMALTIGSASAFAADIGNGVATTGDNQITVPKGVTFINEDSVTSYGPGITYTYTLAPAEVAAGTTVTDSNDNSTTVHAGPAGGLTLESASLAFPASETNTTSASGTQHSKNIVMNFDGSAFERAGVYRYVLTDTTSAAALYAAGITRDADYDTTRYIDVFVKNVNGTMTVYGYALKTENNTTTAASDKDPGFVSESPAEDGTSVDTDRYKTYNVTLTKQVAGTLADTEHEFPFAITVANDGKSYNAAKGNVAAAASAEATAATSLTTSLKHTQTYTIAGLSPHATVAYQETNDTTDLYEVTAAGSTSALTVTDDGNKHYAVAAGAVSTYENDNTESSVAAVGSATNYQAVTYTNTLEEVSPTGLVLRYGAYVFMIAMALALLAVFRKRENTVDEI